MCWLICECECECEEEVEAETKQCRQAAPMLSAHVQRTNKASTTHVPFWTYPPSPPRSDAASLRFPTEHRRRYDTKITRALCVQLALTVKGYALELLRVYLHMIFLSSLPLSERFVVIVHTAQDCSLAIVHCRTQYSHPISVVHLNSSNRHPQPRHQ